MNEFCYYIGIGSVSSKTSDVSPKPRITKIKSTFTISINGPEMEGPFSSIAELKKNSKIYSKIQNQKTIQSILKPENIIEIEKFNLIPFKHSYTPQFIALFLHTWVGKISKNYVSGIHYLEPNRVRILEIVDKNPISSVFLARISVYDTEKNLWVVKEKPSNFFPNHWSLQKLFEELNLAFQNKIHSEGNVYYGFTSENIKVKIVIKDGKGLTMFPLINS